MDVQAKSKIRAWLMGAATAGVLGPALTLGQSDEPSLPAAKQTASRVSRRPLSTQKNSKSNFVTPVAYEMPEGGVVVAESEIEYQLRLLYERDGREMPNMQLTAPAPAEQPPAQRVEVPAPAAPPATKPIPEPAPQPAARQVAQPTARPAPPSQAPTPAAAPRKTGAPNTSAEAKRPPSNKVATFFKKMVPGGTKKPDQPQLAAVPPRQLPATASAQPAAPRQRLPQPAANVLRPMPAPLQKPAGPQIATSPQLGAPQAPVIRPASPPAALSPSTPLPAARLATITPATPAVLPPPTANSAPAVVTTPETTPSFLPPSPTVEVANRSTVDARKTAETTPSFVPPSPAAPIVVNDVPAEAGKSPELTLEVEPSVAAAPSQPTESNPVDQAATVATDDFPDPFPSEQPAATPAEPEVRFAESEPQADPAEATTDDSEPAITNPYSGKALSDEAAMDADDDDDLDDLDDDDGESTVKVPLVKFDEVREDTDSVAAKMRRIIQRADMKGLKGFCPVTLRDERNLADSVPEFVSSHRGQKFYFASQAALIKFDQHPERYAPAAYGADVVVLTRDQDVLEGTLDHAAWYRGRLYLFANRENHDLFVKQPDSYSNPPGID